ncbi:MAG TPA: FtsW/RodA/SpoVE family cell cycle protein, partial [Vicinamibacterales bacterium]|nr:FtsW/RodA/SpoVE family cell cycle protein [Vicinamibacterales bacterium]
FVGVLVVLALYAFVVLRAVDTARRARDRLGALLVVGVLSSFLFQVVYNVSMSAGLAPVKGLTLPLMSYGGSSLIATLAGVGLILNVRMRRFTN